MHLAVQDLGVARGGFAVLEGLTFRVEAGTSLILRGPNGIGKTTLLRAIAGLQPPLKGSIDAPEDSIAYAAHSDGIKQALTVRENLEFWAAVFGTGDITGALDAFALQPLAQRPAGALSAGQKRRLGLARLLVSARPIWVLDEPTVSLDVDAVAMFAAAIHAHLETGGVALIATHIDLGLDADILDVARFKARTPISVDDAMEGFF